jgi:hypothetical protein
LEADITVPSQPVGPVLPAAPEPHPVQWGSILQFGLSLVAVLGIWLFAFLMAIFGAAALVSQPSGGADSVSMFLMAGSLTGAGLLLIPSVYYGLMRLLGRPAFDSLSLIRRTRPELWIVLLPPVLLAGYLVSQVPVAAALLLPPLHILGVGIPVAWMLFLGIRSLPLGSSQRAWGVYDAGMALGPFLISIAELGAMVAVMVLAAGYIASDTRLTAEVMRIIQQIQSGQPSQEEILKQLTPYLTRPAVILSVLAFGSLIVPLTEEALKSIGVWLLVGHRISPQAGFAAGAISGAGYAFMESLLLTSNGQGWAALMVARIGTSALHIFTTAMMGWALVLAWQRGRYLRLAATYLGMVLLHGTWNGLTLYTAFQTLGSATEDPAGSLAGNPVAIVAPFILVGLAVGSLVALVAINRSLALKTPSARLSGLAAVYDAPLPPEEQIGSNVDRDMQPAEVAEVYEDHTPALPSEPGSGLPGEPAGDIQDNKEIMEP